MTVSEVAFRHPPLTLEATAFTLEQCIFPDAPQVALAGRSNVGKSSLINALAGRKQLAKTSATPGKTRSINYYRIGQEDVFLVDLPGYGYARCSMEERNKWARLLEIYFTKTPGLKAQALLLDARLAPQKSDMEMAAFALSLKLPLVPVLTKTDKCSKRELQECMRAWGAYVDASTLISTSAQGKTGLAELWGTIEGYLKP